MVSDEWGGGDVKGGRGRELKRVHIGGGGGRGECVGKVDESNVMHIERINVHRVLSINSMYSSMYSRSYSQNQHVKKSHT